MCWTDWRRAALCAAIGLGSILGLGAITAPAAAMGGVHLRNCVPDSRVFVCAFNPRDQSMDTPDEARAFGFGAQHHVRCGTKRCKTFVGGHLPKPHGLSPREARRIGGAMIEAGKHVTVDAIKAMAVEPEYAQIELYAAGVGAILMVTGASLPAITEGIHDDTQCQRIVKRYPKRDQGARGELTGHHVFLPVYIEKDGDSFAGYALAKGKHCPTM